MFYPIKFKPIPQKRIWGGNKLKEWFELQTEDLIGEYWVLSGHPSATSIVENGRLAGRTLVELTQNYSDVFLGNSPQDRFPLLIKFLEAEDDLSVQIHPDDTYAKEMEGDFGKTEAWFILDCKDEAKVNYGHRFSSREEYIKAVEEKHVENYLSYKDIRPDDLVLVPSQSLHAILAGTMLIEVQQTSDVTYRVFDWNRVDKNGKERDLHIEKAADVMTYGDYKKSEDTNDKRFFITKTPRVIHEHLVTCPYFVIEKLSIKKNIYNLQLGKRGNPDVLIVASGEGILTSGNEIEPLPFKCGDTILIPNTIKSYKLYTSSQTQILRTYY